MILTTVKHTFLILPALNAVAMPELNLCIGLDVSIMSKSV